MGILKANKLHIGILGKRNAGKSTLMNILLGQDFSIVSDTPGTTTDVNEKSMELLPIGPVVLLDTAGIDDVNELGEKRVEKTYKAIKRIDCAIIVFDYGIIGQAEIDLLDTLKKYNIPSLILINKNDISKINQEEISKIERYFNDILFVSLKDDKDIVKKIKYNLLKIVPEQFKSVINPLYGIVKKNDSVVLVIPIDKEAPKDRLILPQVQIIRNLLDNKCSVTICDVDNLLKTLNNLKTLPNLVITDSQAFASVSSIVPFDIPLTSFSIIFAHYKGDLKKLVSGASKIDLLEENDRILICESCTHHPIEDDIGRVKIPNLLKKFTSKNLIFEHYSGYDFPDNLEKYSLIIHCGACMTNKTEMINRINIAEKNGIPITNYGVAIAKCLGILPRSIKPFENLI